MTFIFSSKYVYRFYDDDVIYNLYDKNRGYFYTFGRNAGY